MLRIHLRALYLMLNSCYHLKNFMVSILNNITLDEITKYISIKLTYQNKITILLKNIISSIKQMHYL